MKETPKISAIESLDLRRAPALFRTARPINLRAETRMYSGAKNSRLTAGWGSSVTSADSEIVSSLRTMRSRCRELVRDASFARRGKIIVVNNVIGSGIGMQAQVRTTRDDLNQRINSDIEEAHENWAAAENCHTGGRLHFSAIEQFCMGQVFEAGEIFIREHFRAFGNSKIPYALEVIEPERVLDEFQPSAVDPRLRVRMGVELDIYHRPVNYLIRSIHPGDVRYSSQDVDRIERVPADEIIHLGIIDRWPQTRCVPWMHAAMRKLEDTEGYSYAEIVRARAQANIVGGLKTPREYGEEVKDENGNVTNRQVTSEAGTFEVLYQDEEMQFPTPTSPNSSADGFLRFLLREIAAGIGVSYESLSRDYSQSNYSSSRLALLDDRDLWRIFQMWFIRSFRMRVHRHFIQQAVLGRAVPSIPIESYAADPHKFEKVRFKPRGWSWVDPTKEVEAYKEAIKAGLTTRTDVIAQTANGRDREDIDEEREQELKESKEMGLVYDTDQAAIEAEIKSKTQPQAPAAAKPAPDVDDSDNGNNAQSNNQNKGQGNGRIKRIHTRV
jgi:lambda family phage portal protein